MLDVTDHDSLSILTQQASNGIRIQLYLTTVLVHPSNATCTTCSTLNSAVSRLDMEVKGLKEKTMIW